MVAGQRNADVDVRALDDGFFSAMAQAKGLDASAVLVQYAGMPYEHGGPERLLDLTIRTGPWGDWYSGEPGGLTLDSFKEQPHGIDKSPMVPRLPDILRDAVRSH